MTILNSDLKFSTKKLKIIGNYLLVITDTNEVIVFSRHDDTTNNISYFRKRYIILNSIQVREEIIDMFGLDTINIISPYQNKCLVIVTKNLVIYYYNILDGLCINKINLSLQLEVKIVNR
jgi:hypothetical protein